MNWDAFGAVAEMFGALAVVLTLGYLALQVRHAKQVAADSNRIARATGVREWALAIATNDDLRKSTDAFVGYSDAHAKAAEAFDVDTEDAARAHYAIIYFFWLHWGQFASSTDEKDIEELRHLIDTWYRAPAVRYQWNHSPIVKPIIDERFVEFVEEILREDKPLRTDNIP